MKQSETVIKVVHSVCGVKTEKYILSTEDRKKVVDLVTESILASETDFSDKAKAKYNTPKLVREYTVGMVSNHLRKAPELNGGVKYVPTNPGSRTGSQDPEVKNIKLLIKSGKLSPEQTILAQQAVDVKVAELRANKAQVEIDYDVIPSDLLKSLGITND